MKFAFQCMIFSSIQQKKEIDKKKRTAVFICKWVEGKDGNKSKSHRFQYQNLLRQIWTALQFYMRFTLSGRFLASVRVCVCVCRVMVHNYLVFKLSAHFKRLLSVSLLNTKEPIKFHLMHSTTWEWNNTLANSDNVEMNNKNQKPETIPIIHIFQVDSSPSRYQHRNLRWDCDWVWWPGDYQMISS